MHPSQRNRKMHPWTRLCRCISVDASLLDAPSWTHLQPDASLARRIWLDASMSDASMLNFGKCVLSTSKRIQPHACSTIGLICTCFQLDASGIDASGQMRLARDASSQMRLDRDAFSWMHPGETHLARCIYTDASMDASFDSTMIDPTFQFNFFGIIVICRNKCTFRKCLKVVFGNTKYDSIRTT